MTVMERLVGSDMGAARGEEHETERIEFRMGCLKIGGKVVGAQEGLSMSFPACYRSSKDRKALGCTKLTFDEVKTGVAAEVDSAFASKVIAALAAKLDEDEMGRVLEILRNADLIDKDEHDAVLGAISPERSEPDAAYDARFPHANRLKRPSALDHGNRLSAVGETFGLDRIKSDPYSARPYGHGDNPNPQAGYDEWHARMFPNAGRLK